MRAILLACVAGLVCTCLFSRARALDLPSMTVPNPMGVQIKRNNTTVEDLDKISKLGLKFVRKGFYWDVIEKEKGKYDFTVYDKFVKDCEDRGLYVLGCFFGNNKHHPKKHTVEGSVEFGKFAAACAAHFKGKKIYWEIWNEPNVCTFWGKHGKHNSPQYAKEYYQLVKATAPQMKKANPTCFVMAGSVSNFWSASQNWMLSIFKLGVLDTGIDAWSIHPYSLKCPEAHEQAYSWTRKMMTKYSKSKKVLPIINSERGFPLGKKEGYAGGKENMAKEYQAWHVVRQYLIDQLFDVRMTNWYEWSGGESFSMYSSKEVLPTYTSTKVMLEQLKGYKLDKRIPLENKLDYVLRYTNTAGSVKLVAWTAPVEFGSPDKIVDHEAQIPVEATGKLTIAAIYGEKSSADVKAGKITLKLTGAPQYITIKP